MILSRNVFVVESLVIGNSRIEETDQMARKVTLRECAAVGLENGLNLGNDLWRKIWRDRWLLVKRGKMEDGLNGKQPL